MGAQYYEEPPAVGDLVRLRTLDTKCTEWMHEPYTNRTPLLVIPRPSRYDVPVVESRHWDEPVIEFGDYYRWVIYKGTIYLIAKRYLEVICTSEINSI